MLQSPLIRIVTVSLALIAGCGGNPRAVTRITVSCPYASPRQIESQITVPLEVALAGTSGLVDLVSHTRPGRVDVYLVHNSRFSPALLQSQFTDFAVGLPPLTDPPMVEPLTAAIVPEGEAGDVEVVQVE